MTVADMTLWVRSSKMYTIHDTYMWTRTISRYIVISSIADNLAVALFCRMKSGSYPWIKIKTYYILWTETYFAIPQGNTKLSCSLKLEMVDYRQSGSLQIVFKTCDLKCHLLDSVICHLSHIYFLATDLQDHDSDQRIFEVMTLLLETRWLVAFL